MHTLLLDLRYALRQLRKHPGFTLIALATLALGIGANTAVFSILHAVLLQPLPYASADRIVIVSSTSPDRGRSGASRLDFDDWRASSHAFEALTAYRGESADVIGGSEPERVVAIAVSGDYFRVFAIAPLLGRTFDAERERATGTPPALISEGFWKSHFGADAGVIGKVVRISGAPHAVVGVMPASFDYPWSQDVWLPLAPSDRDASRSARNYKVAGRLREGASLEAASAEMSAIALRLARTYPDSNRDSGVVLERLRDELTASVRPTLLLLVALVALVMLIACVNLAGLLLARGRARSMEMAIRGALGAKTSRLIRQLLTETTLLSLVGGCCGLLAAFWVSRLLATSAALERFMQHRPLLDARVLLFALGLSVLTAALSGVVPALRIARAEVSHAGLQPMLHRDGKDPLRRLLVAAEVALSVLLLVASGLLTRSMVRLQNEALGFDPTSMRIVSASAPADGDPVAFYDDVLQRAKSLPGVVAIAAASDLPLGADKTQGGLLVQGRSTTDEKTWLPAGWQLVNEDYFAAMKVPILRGRSLQQSDRGGVRVAVVNDALARRYWPADDALGKQFAVPGLDSSTYERFQQGEIDWITVVGIAGDVRPGGPGTEPMPEIYLPYFQHAASAGNLKLAVRGDVAPVVLDRMLQESIGSIAPEVPVRIRSYEDALDRRLATPRLRARLVTFFAILAIVLAAGGMYGVTSNWVEQRTREIGIRMAHGAKVRDIVALFIRRGLTSTFIGIMIGVTLAIWLASLLAPFLYRIDPRDPLTFLAAIAIALLTATLAVWIPARRAARVNPADTLHYQ